MDLRQLRYFVAVCDEGGIRAAARRLQLSQPSVSYALRALEAELGVTLLQRGGRAASLTPAGEELLERARRILASVDEARSAIQRLRHPQFPTLRIGLMSGIVSAGELLAPIVEAFRATHPDVAVDLHETSFAEHALPLIDERVDVMLLRGPFGRGPLADPAIDIVPIAEEPRVLLVGPSHELAAEDRVAAEDVLDYPTLPLAAPDAWSSFWQLNDLRGGANADGAIRPVATVPEVQLAVATRAVVVTSPATLARLQPNPLVRTIALDGAPRAVIGVGRRKQDRRLAVRQFIGTAQAVAERHIGLLPDGVVPP